MTLHHKSWHQPEPLARKVPFVQPEQPCPTPGKKAFASRADAKKFVKRARVKYRNAFDPNLAHVYLCPCACFHLGSLPAGGTRDGARYFAEKKLADGASA